MNNNNNNNNKADKKKNKNPLPSTSRFTAFSNTSSTLNTDNNTKVNSNKYEDQVLKRYILKYLDGCFNKMKSLDILLKNTEDLVAQKGAFILFTLMI